MRLDKTRRESTNEDMNTLIVVVGPRSAVVG
jgi:hypothetical protein